MPDAPARIPLTQNDLRLIGLWAADCAERVQPLFAAIAPADPRPREALAGIRVYGHGCKRTVRLRTEALAALAAAREVAHPAAAAAAQSAGYAAAIAYTKALAAPHHAKHTLAPAVYAALARELATTTDLAISAADAELHWAIAHATPQVRAIISRWPAHAPGRTRLATLFHQLDAGLRR